MHKEELVMLHLTLFHVKRFFEEAGIANGYFKEYEKLGVQPVHIHKSKSDHQKAIYTLCKAITEIFKERRLESILDDPKVREALSKFELH